jgi:DNA invertase Pin-like site-specific DNA recombinase
MSQMGSPLLTQEKKVGRRHLERLAVVYVRQSSVHQVQRNQESTQLQYGLVDHAARLGWPRERTVVIDDDLGVSGASSEGRLGFQRLLSEVALDHVGIILGVEMSRLARSCKDWYQLLELCALFGTLISDLDGLYDPTCYNDRLLLGLKGTMSEAELHIIRQRMWQGALQKARRGELITKGPVGYVRAGDQLVMDPDEQARSVVQLIFEQFDRLGTMHAVLRYLVDNGIRLPVRSASDPNKGQLEWRRPNQTALQVMLTHPVYAGAYVFGRSCQSKAARQQRRPYRVPRSEWLVLLRDRYPAYITWQQYEENQSRLEQNRSRYGSRCSVRSGRALLAGLVVCARCGRTLRTQYGSRACKPRYSCTSGQALYGEPRCQTLAAQPLDDEVVRLTLTALQPSALDVSLRVAADIQHQREEAEKLWRQRLERAAYESERAARQYHAVEPENRLVARTLEAAWEERLRAQREVQEQYERFRLEQPKVLTPDEQERIRRLAADVPLLWQAATTTDADRKEILRELIDRVEVNVEGESEWVEAKIRWTGGHQTYTRFRRPVQRFEQLSAWRQLRRRVEELLSAHVSVPKIAEQLTTEGFRTVDGKPFSEGSVRMFMTRQRLCSLRNRPNPAVKLRKHEWLIPELARELGVGHATVYAWIREERVTARKLKDGRCVITADKAKCRELAAYQARRRRRPAHISPGATKER